MSPTQFDERMKQILAEHRNDPAAANEEAIRIMSIALMQRGYAAGLERFANSRR